MEQTEPFPAPDPYPVVCPKCWADRVITPAGQSLAPSRGIRIVTCSKGEHVTEMVITVEPPRWRHDYPLPEPESP